MEHPVKAHQLDRFDRFFDTHYQAMVDETADRDPSGAVRRTRAGFASAYRFWGKVEDDGDPAGWIRRVIAEDRHGPTRRVDPESADEPGTPAFVDLRDERRRVVALARRQRVVAGGVLGAGALVWIGAELLVTHR
jgi:hypothetical protein